MGGVHKGGAVPPDTEDTQELVFDGSNFTIT